MSDDKLEEINNFNSIKQIIKEKDSSYIFPTISNEDDIIIEKLNLSYNFNPIDHVLFYDNDGQILKIDNKNIEIQKSDFDLGCTIESWRNMLRTCV